MLDCTPHVQFNHNRVGYALAIWTPFSQKYMFVQVYLFLTTDHELSLLMRSRKYTNTIRDG